VTERPSAKAIRDTFERPTVFGVFEAEPIRLVQPEPAPHGLKAMLARSASLHLRRTA
jgi:hypothetical protein